MNEFKNELIREEHYQNGLFPEIPNFSKRGSAFVLTGGTGDDLLVTEHTTVQQIRKGKYTLLAEISTKPYIKNIQFTSPSKEVSYMFDVYVKAVIQVQDPIRFYENHNLDVDTYFEKLFLMDVKKITKCYSILENSGMDEELTRKLSSYNTTIDEDTGFSYTISAVDARPGELAKEYVDQYSKRQLDMALKKQAEELIQSLSMEYEKAIMAEVVEGRRTQAEAILAIQSYKDANYETQMKRMEELLKKGMITDEDARKKIIEGLGIERRITTKEEQTVSMPEAMDHFYSEEE